MNEKEIIRYIHTSDNKAKDIMKYLYDNSTLRNQSDQIYASSSTSQTYSITTDKMTFVTAVDPSTQAKGTAKVKKGDKFDMRIGLEIALARMHKVNLDKQIARYL